MPGALMTMVYWQPTLPAALTTSKNSNGPARYVSSAVV